MENACPPRARSEDRMSISLFHPTARTFACACLVSICAVYLDKAKREHGFQQLSYEHLAICLVTERDFPWSHLQVEKSRVVL